MDSSFDFNVLLQKNSKKHKQKPEQFMSMEGGKQKRIKNILKNQKSNRLTVFDSLRNLPRSESPAPTVTSVIDKIEHRKQQLEKWKLEKEQKKKEEAKNKKKPFLVGVVSGTQRYMPPPPPPIKPMPSTSGRVTRSQTSRARKTNDTKKANPKTETSFAPPNSSFHPPQLKHLSSFPVLAPVTKKNTKKLFNLTFDPVIPKKPQKVNINKTIATMPAASEKVTKAGPVKAVVDNKRVTRSRATNLKSKSETALQKPKLAKNVDTSSSTSSFDQPESIESPKVTLRRSSRHSIDKTPRNSIPKSESSSEEKLRSPKNSEMMTPSQIAEESKKISPCVTMSRGKSNARDEMKKKLDEGYLDADSCSESVEHFRRQLAAETERIHATCDLWDDLYNKVSLPDHVQEAVLSAVGQARLLAAQKFQQFGGLLARCSSRAPPLVTPADLAGFWDMLFIQVENVDMRFKNLEQLRANNWQQRDVTAARRRPAAAAARTRRRPAATSKITHLIAEARKAKQQANLPSAENKTFEAGFFCVRSPVRSPVCTPSKHSLLKVVLSSEAKKASTSRKSASFAMLRATKLGKEVESPTTESTPTRITPINLYATPARSILKSANKEATRKSKRKSIKVVLFNDSDTDLQNTSNNDLYQNAVETKIDCTPKKIVNSPVKENRPSSVKRRSKIMRQSAIDDGSPMLTRSRRKSLQDTPKQDSYLQEELVKKSSKKKILQELNDNVEEKMTPRRISRSRKSSAV